MLGEPISTLLVSLYVLPRQIKSWCELEEGVYGHSSSIYRGYSRRSNHDIPFMCLCPQVPQEGGLARARLAGQKDVALSILCVFVRQVKFWILHFLFSLKSVRIDHEYLFF